MRLFWREPRFAWQASVGLAPHRFLGREKFWRNCWKPGTNARDWISGHRYYPAARLAKGWSLSLILISLWRCQARRLQPVGLERLRVLFSRRECSQTMANSRISRNRPMNPSRRAFQRSFWMMVAFMVIGLLGMSGCSATGPTAHDWRPFGFMSDPDYNFFERFALIANVL